MFLLLHQKLDKERDELLWLKLHTDPCGQTEVLQHRRKEKCCFSSVSWKQVRKNSIKRPESCGQRGLKKDKHYLIKMTETTPQS